MDIQEIKFVKEIGNWFGDYKFENGKHKIDNGEKIFEYTTARECLLDWLDTLIEADKDTGEDTWKDVIDYIKEIKNGN